MTEGIRISGKSVFVRGAMALAIVGAALLVEYTPAAPVLKNSPPTKQVSSALPSAASRPAGVDAASKAQAMANYGRLPLSFEANNGQTNSAVKFLSRGQGYNLFLTGDEAVLTLEKSSVVSRQSSVASPQMRKAGLRTPDSEPRTSASVLRMKLVGANSNATVRGAAELPGKSNYFIGNDPKKWRTDVPTYAQVKYQGVYPGVDLVYYGNQSGQLEYDFVVAPGADPNAIALGLGTKNHAPLRIAEDGGIVVKTDAGDVRFHKPVIYQEELTAHSSQLTVQNQNRKMIEGNYVLEANNQVGFKVASYDHSKPLVIDPVATYSTYLGGSAGDYAYAIAIDSTGAAYVAGGTASTDFPTLGAYQGTVAGGYDCFVTKLAPGGGSLVYSTYVGGSSTDNFDAIALDSSLNVVATGYVQSADYPVLNPLPGQSTYAGGYNETVVTKLNSSGNALIYSTYLGGAGDGFPEGMTLDAGGDAYVVGEADAPTYPVVNAIQSTPGSTYTGTLSRLHWNGTALSLVFSTFWGGNFTTSANAVAVDNNNHIYVGGFTEASVFPTTAGVYQTAAGGGFDGFVTKFNWNSGTSTLSTVYSTYLGGMYDDSVIGLVIDGAGDAYLTGYTASPNFPVPNAVQSTLGGNYDAFATELNPTGTGILFSTYLGGSGYDQAQGIVLGSGGNIFVTGYTASTNFPTSNAVQSVCGCNSSTYDAFVTGLNWNGTALTFLYSTYLGGSSTDAGYGIAVDSSQNVYVTGYTKSTDFPTTNNAYQTVYGGGSNDAFVTKLPLPVGPGATLSTNTVPFGNQPVNTPSSKMSVNLTSSGTTSLVITSIASSGDFALTTTGTSCTYTGETLPVSSSCTIDIIFTPSTGGARTGTLTITDNSEGVVGSTQTVDLTGTGTGGGVVSFMPSTLAIGNQVVNTSSAPAVLTLNNTGALSFTISSIIVGGINGTDFAKTADACTGVAVAPSSSCTISITFTPSAQGARSGILVFADNTVGSPQFVNVTGSGTAPIAIVTPSTLPSFGTENQGSTSASQAVTVNNGGNGPLTIASIVTSANFGETNTCTGNTVAVGVPCTINVTFTPTANGPLTGTLTVTDNSLGVAGTTQTVSLSGTGTGAPLASLSTSSLTFAPILDNTTSASQTVTVTNTGALPLVITSIATTGNFAQTSACATVAASATCSIGVTFAPNAGGQQSGTLTITDNSGGTAGSTQVVTLTGTAQDFGVTATTPTSQTVAPGGLASYTLSVGNLGGLNQNVTFSCSGAPAEAYCVVAPSPAAPGSFVGVSVTTTGASASALRIAPPAPPTLPRPQMLLMLAVVLMGISWTLMGRNIGTRRLRRVLLPLVVAALLVLAVTGCGGGKAVTQNAGTPAGTYPLTITGTSGSLTHTVTLTLIVS